MLNQTTEQLEFRRAMRTVVNMLLMHWALQMLIQMRKSSELPGAEIAFVLTAVPCRICGPAINSSIRVGICEQAVRDEMVCIPGTNLVVDCVASNTRDASSGFKMDRHS